MIGFFCGVGVTVAITFFLLWAIGKASKKMQSEIKLASAIYDEDKDLWKVRGNFLAVAQKIEHRIKHGKPGSVKYID